ncbi:hypothetical protein DSCO28_52570 [Desulfosarcina ovata subsp. sediminis]|uniref:Phosphotyrosine protein phosphatase I domain-containing protein n=1 Tax=Desulfosarcina ovata subsp. sediminis TaxID=885957 RepID=A0A5K7ZX46_9BACT|nr:NAD(P)H-dependent oxidoreductase [Desulfosarcina ovata]BBO84691.1 hypothetical protein DSCO28_52570 [Desulfosarcina ovata subsp. sediminis]
MFILGLQGSPRKNGNTDTLLAAFLEKAAAAGAAVHTVQAARAGVTPCKGCGYCETHGTCVIKDDPMSTELFGLLRQADMVVAASPVYFYGVSAQLKVLIDRCQTFWSRKYVYKLKDPLVATREGVLLSVAASRGRQLFDGIQLTAKYFFDAIDARFSHALTYRGVESKGAIRSQSRLAEDIEAIIEKSVRPMVARKKILFVSRQGGCRAPLAAAMAQQRYGDRIRTAFGGRQPAAVLSVPMVQAMQKIGLDLGYRTPLAMDQAFYGMSPDLVVTIGTTDTEPPMAGVETVNWPIPNPPGMEEAQMEGLRLAIGNHVDRLIQWIERPSP